MASALDELKEFEQRADIEIAKLSLWKQPIRSILSRIYLIADGEYVGMRFNRRMPRNKEVGIAMITRMSYIVHFFSQCPRDVGSDIDDVLSVVNDQFDADIVQLLVYAHFCEIMPHVRKDFFAVERHASGFVLKHPNEEFVKHEEQDTLMSEMALPHELAPPPYPIESCKRMIKTWPEIPADALFEVLKGAYDHYIQNVFEFPLLDDEGFQKGFDFSRADFTHMRAGLMAYADFCLGMADAAEVLSERAFTRPKRTILQREVREWAAPFQSRNHIIGLAAGISAVEPSVAERIVDLFTIDLDSVDRSKAGEGYFPPFLRLGDNLLFSPHAMKETMLERNILYAMNRKQADKKSFDNFVSKHLEPVLIDEAAKLLLELAGVEVKKNEKWKKGKKGEKGNEGEIDLLAYHAPSNSAFQLQAKAVVTPEGARMVKHVESRTLTAAKQIESFLSLSGEEKDKICSIAFGRKLSGVAWSSGILMRTCLGTQKAWSGIKDFVPLNPVLLSVAVKRMSEAGEFTFMTLGQIVKEELAHFRSDAVVGWENKSFTLFGEQVTLPMLKLSPSAISDFRLRLVS